MYQKGYSKAANNDGNVEIWLLAQSTQIWDTQLIADHRCGSLFYDGRARFRTRGEISALFAFL